MDEKDLIRQLKALQQTKPSQSWAFYAKKSILGGAGEERVNPPAGWRVSIIPGFGLLRFISSPRRVWGPAFALSAFALIAGLFVLTQQSAPGDTLYSVKKAAKQQTASLISDPTEAQLNLVADSAKALKRIAERNETEKLAPAIEEYESNLKKASAALDNPPDDGKAVVKLAEEANEIKRLALEIEEVLQTKIAEQDMEEFTRKVHAMVSSELEEVEAQISVIVEEGIASLEGASLTEDQEELLNQVKAAYEQGEHALALELLRQFGE